MNDAFGKVVAILISVYLMFIAPVTYMIEENGRTRDVYLLTIVTEFVEEVKNTGIITEEQYRIFSDRVSMAAATYDIKMVHSKHGYNIVLEEQVFNEVNVFTEEIEEILLNEGQYYLKESDFFKVSICDSNNVSKVFFAGGIKNEAY